MANISVWDYLPYYKSGDSNGWSSIYPTSNTYVATPTVSSVKAVVPNPKDSTLMQGYTKYINNGGNLSLGDYKDNLRYQQTLGDASKRQASLDAYRQQSKANANSGFWGNLGNNIINYVQDNPLDAMGTVASGAMNLWNAYQGYKNNKETYQLNQDYYNLAKSQYEANEARNKEAFNWQRQNRLSSSL